jgi:succinyl-CoA synthetase beta subunit
MKLFEYEAKEILAKHGIPTPQGAWADSASKAKRAAARIQGPYVVKAQVLVAGRGKAGGIQFAGSVEEVEQRAKSVLGMEIKGLKVGSVLVEERMEIAKELYFGITVDRSQRRYVAIASTEGGVDIEEVASATPERITRLFISPTKGFRQYHALYMAAKLGYDGERMFDLSAILEKSFKLVLESDAELFEMNPLVETADGRFVAADARCIIDDNALYRHPQYSTRLSSEARTERTLTEIEAGKAGLAYVQLEGNIGLMGNGAGLVMATLDMVKHFGGLPANFLDVGGGASEDQIVTAFELLLKDPDTTVVFTNILGGITRCDDVARGILKARQRTAVKKPIVIRLVGTNQEEGRNILRKAGIPVFDSMEDAAKAAVEMSDRRR